MGDPIQLSGGNGQAKKSAEYLRHFGISYCPFSASGGGQLFWSSHSLDDLRREISATIMEPGLLVISEPDMQLASPARELIQNLLNDDVVMASIESLPDLPEELLLEILRSFGFDSADADLSECRSVMQAFLSHSAKVGSPPVIVLQQAEPANEAIADEIGRLLNLRESGRPCVKLIMMGRPEVINLNDVKFNDLPISHVDLKGMVRQEVADSIFERLNESGRAGRDLFTPAAVAYIAEITGGVPGLVNQICAVAMSEAFEQKMSKVTKGVLLKALEAFEFSLPEPTIEELVADCIAGGGVANGHITNSEIDSAKNAGAEAANDESEKFPYFDMSRDGKQIARFRLDCGRLTIGRHKSNEIYVPSNGVSLFHAVVIRENNEVYIFDLRSTNGTAVNGRDISRKRLSKGDSVIFGSLRLTYFPGVAQTQNNVSNILNFAETVVLEENDAPEPTVYFRGTF